MMIIHLVGNKQRVIALNTHFWSLPLGEFIYLSHVFSSQRSYTPVHMPSTRFVYIFCCGCKVKSNDINKAIHFTIIQQNSVLS